MSRELVLDKVRATLKVIASATVLVATMLVCSCGGGQGEHTKAETTPSPANTPNILFILTIMLTLGQEDPIRLRNIVMPRASYRTIFLLFDRPPRANVGTYFPIEVRQLEARKQRIIGGLNARVEVVPSHERGERGVQA